LTYVNSFAAMTKVYKIDLTKGKLAAMAAEERQLLLLLGHAANEINVLQKLILMASQATPELKFVDHVQAGQVFVLMRTLIGKLHEAWELFVKRFQSAPQISAKYRSKLNTEAITALESLKRHFGKQSPLTLIRNGFSFHYYDEKGLVEKSFQDIPSDDSWHFYLSNITGNCFYYASELVVAAAVINLANPAINNAELYLAQSERAFRGLCELIISVSEQIMTLFGQCIAEIVSENLSDTEISDPVEIVGAPSLGSIQIPFFIDDIEFKPKADSGVFPAEAVRCTEPG
jgi:hypothetical protein